MEDAMIWTRRKGKRTTVGLRRAFVTDNPVTFIELLGVGTRVNPHGAIGLAQFAKGREAEIESPVAGKIVEVNEAVNCREQPAPLNDDPEGQGWLVVIEEP
jgi:glycine cleavage system H lipoate-binding protein